MRVTAWFPLSLLKFEKVSTYRWEEATWIWGQSFRELWNLLTKKLEYIPTFEQAFTLYHPIGKQRYGKTFIPLSNFPSVQRDISVFIPETHRFPEVIESLLDMGDSVEVMLVKSLQFSEQTEREGKPTMLFRFVLQSANRTLSKKDIKEVTRSFEGVLRAYGYEIR